MFDCLSIILGLLLVRSVWLVGGDFNAEVGFRGIGEETTLNWVVTHTVVGLLGLGASWLNGLWARTTSFF